MWSLTHILSLAAGLGLLGLGLYFLSGHRVPHSDESLEDVAPKGRFPWFSQQLRLVLGVSLMIGGYHVAAYGSPDGWFPLKVSRDLWWVVPGLITIALGLTLTIDRLTRTGRAS